MFARALRKPVNLALTRPENPRNLQQWVHLAQMHAGVRLTIEDAFEVSVVWACISVIAKSIAASPWRIFQILPDGDRDLLPRDPLVYLLNTRANPDMTAIAAREALMIAALSWGNGYMEIVPDNAGRVSALWPMLPDRVTPERNPDNGQKQFRYSNPDQGGETILPSERVFHLQGPSINGLLGDNHIAKAAKAIALAKASEMFSSSFFGNGTILSGVLEYPHTLNDTSYDRLKKSIETEFKGPGKAYKPLLLEGGMKWTPIGTEPEKSQLIESRKFQVEDIARWFGVPPHKIGHLDRATWNNIEHLGLEFTRDALTPWAERLTQEADFKLLSARGRPRFTVLDMQWLRQGDAKSRAEANAILRRNGVINANDWLRSEGMNTIGTEGDVYLVEANMQRLDQVGMQEAPAPVIEAPEPDEEPTNILCEAVQMLFQSVFDRYCNRIKSRQTDLERNRVSRADMAGNLARLKVQMQPVVQDELRHPAELAAKVLGLDAEAVHASALSYLTADTAPTARGFLESLCSNS